MREFKLIKRYPGSPKLGTIIHKPSDIGTGNIYKLYTNGKGFGIENPYDYPEYWEEIVGYEIQSFVAISSDSNGKPSKRLFNGKHTWPQDTRPSETSEESLLNDSTYTIHSVKRLTDDMVFTLGDLVEENITGKCEGWEITEFSLKDTRCFSAGVNINNLVFQLKKDHKDILAAIDEYLRKPGRNQLRFWQALFNMGIIENEALDPAVLHSSHHVIQIKDDHNISDKALLKRIERAI